MANRAEQKGDPRVTGLAESRRGTSEPLAPTNGPPSASAALEKLTSATQRVVTKRIDLLMLEVHELVGSLAVKAALMGFGVVVGLAAWFAAISALVLYQLPTSSLVYQLMIFAAINAVVGVVVAGFALRKQLPVLADEAADTDAARAAQGRSPSEGGE